MTSEENTTAIGAALDAAECELFAADRAAARASSLPGYWNTSRYRAARTAFFEAGILYSNVCRSRPLPFDWAAMPLDFQSFRKWAHRASADAVVARKLAKQTEDHRALGVATARELVDATVAAEFAEIIAGIALENATREEWNSTRALIAAERREAYKAGRVKPLKRTTARLSTGERVTVQR